MNYLFLAFLYLAVSILLHIGFMFIIDSPYGWMWSFVYMLEAWVDLTLFQKIAGPGSLILSVACWYMGVESTLKEAKKG